MNEKINGYEENSIKLLNDIGVSGAEIDINYEIIDNKIQINIVSINLKNSVINSSLTHIDIIKKIKTTITDYLGVSEDLIKIYE